MALTLQLTIGTACPGGEHYPVTGTPTPGTPRTFDYSREELLAAITDAEMEVFLRVLTRLYQRQISTGTPAQIRTAINAKVLDLGVSL